jgi:beta-fructofuranosidase
VTRPELHFTADQGWINDPYGVTWRDGRYHLFFQHVREATEWSLRQHWGHATSDDLVHWSAHDVVLSPDADDDGIWSGTVAPVESGLILYTSVGERAPQIGVVRAARPLDDWDTWEKLPGAVVTPPAGLDLIAFRDPYIVRDAGQWRMVVGGGLADGTGVALTWTSTDCRTWTYGGVLASRHSSETDPVWTGSVWECPQLFTVEDAWVLLISVWADDVTRYEACAVGDLVDGRFVARSWQRLTHGAHYAGSAFRDAEGRQCLIHWLRGVADLDEGWAGAHSVPHVLSLEDDRVVLTPHPAVAVRAVADGERTVLVDGPIVEVFGPDGVAGYVLTP